MAMSYMRKKDNCGVVIPDSFYPVESLRKYIHLGTVKNYAKNSAVIIPGETTNALIIVLEGRIRVNLINDDGREVLLYFAGKNCLLGRLFPTENNIYAVAIRDSIICRFTKDKLNDIFRDNEEIPFDIMKNYLAKVAYYMRQVAEINSYNPTIRILRLIYKLCIIHGKQLENAHEIVLPLSQASIAEITGAHYVTVSRVLNCLKKERVLNKKKDKIIIYDLEKLKLLSEQSTYY